MIGNNLTKDGYELLGKWEEDLDNKKQRLSETTNEDEALQLSSGIKELSICIEELEAGHRGLYVVECFVYNDYHC